MAFKGWETEKLTETLKKKISKTQSQNILETIGDMIVRDTVKRMASNKVKPKTTAKTLAARRFVKGRSARYAGGITLISTGGLIGSIIRKVDISKLRVRIGTNKEYARIQQLGGRTGRKRRTRIPARPYLFFTSFEKIQIRRMIARQFNS